MADPFGFEAAINWDVVDAHAEEIAAIFDKGGRGYDHTHVSVEDGSPAMLVTDNGSTLTLVNEDGFTWTDPADQWERIFR